MAGTDEHHGVEHDIERIKASVEKHLSSGGHVGSEAAADLTKAVHELGDHLVSLHQRMERIEDSHDEWTTHGWEPPPGADRPS